jgi:hypothetical protein
VSASPRVYRTDALKCHLRKVRIDSNGYAGAYNNCYFGVNHGQGDVYECESGDHSFFLRATSRAEAKAMATDTIATQLKVHPSSVRFSK